jgi:hypothetical protein
MTRLVPWRAAAPPSEVIWINGGLALRRSAVRAPQARGGIPARKALGGLATLLVTLATLAIPAAGSLPAATAAAASAEVCPGVPVPQVQSAAPDTALNTMFTSYGNDNTRTDDWTGADSTYSVRLAGGREAWLFSDTFLGIVNPDGSRPPVIEEGGTTPFINNSMVVQQGGTLTTVHGGTAAKPAAIMPPPDSTHWYWAGSGIFSGGLLQQVYMEFERFGSGGFDFAWKRNVLARFAPGRLDQPVDVRPLPSSANIEWGSWQLQGAGGWTYLYGVEDLGLTKYMHVARVQGPDLAGPWQYLDASGAWSSSEADSARITDGVSNEYSVTSLGAGRPYVLVTQDTTELFSSHVVAWFSCSPTGPWSDKTLLYTTPETGLSGSYGNANVFSYNPHAHPELGGPGRLVITYNVNSFVNTDTYKDVSVYRPRFVDVQFAPPSNG